MSTDDGMNGDCRASTPADTSKVPDEVLQALRDYNDRLAESLSSCAIYGNSDPELFLWHVRRSVEAFCLLLRTFRYKKVDENPWGIEGKSSQGKGPAHLTLEALIDDLRRSKVITEEVQGNLHALRMLSNPGVHLSGPTRPAHGIYKGTVMGGLPELVEWLYTQSCVRQHIVLSLETQTNIESIRSMRSGLDGPPPLDKQIRQLRMELSKLREAETRALEQRNYAGNKMLELQREVASLRSQLETERVVAIPKKRSLLKTLGAAILTVILLCGALFVIAGGGLAYLTARIFSSNSPSPLTSLDASPVAQGPAVVPSAVSAPPAPIPVEPAPPVPRGCPSGTVEIPSTRIRLSQPFPNRSWPGPSNATIEPIDVPSFCLEMGPRSWINAPGLSGGGEQNEHCEGVEPAAETLNPVNCVTRGEAASFCASAFPGGRLPEIREWEAVLQGETGRLIDTKAIDREWVADTFPPRIFGRKGSEDTSRGLFRAMEVKKPRESDLTRWSWKDEPAEKRSVRRGFRCAVPLE